MGGDADLSAYDGLVFRTAQMFHRQVGLELEDMRQELFLKIVKARRTFDPSRSSMTERAFVYSCLANFVKDLKRVAVQRHNAPLRVGYIHDEGLTVDRFDWLYLRATHEEIYGAIEDGTFVLPSTINRVEKAVLLLLMLGYRQTEVAERLELDYTSVSNAVRRLRSKLADWRPNTELAPLPVGEPLAA